MPEHCPLAGRVAVVAGPPGPLHAAVSAALGAAGATVASAGASGPEAEAARDAGHVSAVADALVASAVASFGRLDLLVNVAAWPAGGPAAELAPARFEAGVRGMLSATFAGCRAAARQMLRQAPDAGGRRGCIVSVTSAVGELAVPGQAALAASAAGIEALTRSLAVEWRPVGIRVAGVAAGLTPELVADAVAMPGASRRVPPGSVVAAAAVARAVVWLAGEAASEITGTTLAVDGGWLADGYWLP